MIEDLWYKNSIIYSLDLETFMDANGDGVGDLPGLINRLDYLNSLGVDVIWLAPFQPSPNRDNGYDISDYYGVDRRYGSSGDFVEFVNHARKRGMRVILDLVVNHTSNEHPWFQEARRDPNSQHRDWYLWSKQRPAGWNKGMVFPGVQKAVWTRDPVAKQYYHHRFYEFQPDLNMDNPHVRAEIRRIMGYWLQLGVDGFRVDAVPFILESRQTPGQKIQFEYLAEMRQFLQWRAGHAALLGEANVTPKETQKYFGDGRDGLNLMFNFWVNQHLFYTLATGDTAPLEQALKDTRQLPAAAQWAVFLRNHDELDIERLPKQKRDKVFKRFGPERSMQLYHRGIRRRLASMLGDRRHIELANSMMFALPGSPVLRYGDEIGMGEDLSLKERDAVRTPMQWSSERNAGFSTARRLIHPVISKGPYSYHSVNVDAQRRDPGSLLNWMIKMIRVRKECPEIGWGEWTLLRTGPGVLGLCYEWRGNRVVVLHNFNRHPQQVRVSLDGEGSDLLVNLLDLDDSRANRQGYHDIALSAYGYKWFRVGGMNYALRRQPAAPSAGD